MVAVKQQEKDEKGKRKSMRMKKRRRRWRGDDDEEKEKERGGGIWGCDTREKRGIWDEEIERRKKMEGECIVLQRMINSLFWLRIYAGSASLTKRNTYDMKRDSPPPSSSPSIVILLYHHTGEVVDTIEEWRGGKERREERGREWVDKEWLWIERWKGWMEGGRRRRRRRRGKKEKRGGERGGTISLSLSLSLSRKMWKKRRCWNEEE